MFKYLELKIRVANIVPKGNGTAVDRISIYSFARKDCSLVSACLDHSLTVSLTIFCLAFKFKHHLPLLEGAPPAPGPKFSRFSPCHAPFTC